MTRLCATLIATWILTLTGPILAATPIPFSTPVTTPIVINQPGTYILTRNLTATGPGPVISITATDVSIDLNGMVITAEPDSYGIQVGTGAFAKISHGSIIGGSHGIVANLDVVLSVAKVRFQGMAYGAVITVGDSWVEIRGCTIENVGVFGILAAGNYNSSGVVEDNDLRNTGDTGIEVWGAFDVLNNRLDHIHNTGQPYGGIVVAGTGGAVRGNTVNDAEGVGIYIWSDSKKVSGNTITGAGDYGIVVQTVQGAGGNNNWVRTNTVSGSAGGIMVFGDLNRIENNVVNLNLGYGLHFHALSNDNIYGGNVGRDNNGPWPLCLGPGNSELCDDGANNTSLGDNWLPDQR